MSMSQRSEIFGYSDTAATVEPVRESPESSAKAPPEPVPRRRRALSALLTPTLLVLALVGSHRAWTWYAQHRLGNAVDALRKSGEPVSLEEIIPAQVPDSANAAVDVRRAIEQIVADQDEMAQAFFNLPGLALPMTERELSIVRPTVVANQSALATVRDAMAKPTVDWTSIAPGTGRGTSMWGWRGSGFMRQRGLLQLLYASALLAHTEKREADALQHVDELLFLARTTGRRPTVRAQRSTARMTEITLGALSELIPDLQIGNAPGQASPQRVRQLIARLLDENEMRESMLRGFRAERARQLDSMTSPGVSRRADGTTIDPWAWGELLPMPLRGSSALEQFMWRPVYLGNVTRALEQVDAGIQCFNSSSYREFLHSFGDPDADGHLNDNDEEAASQIDQANTNLARQLNFEIESAARGYYISLAERRAAALALAICLYRADHEGKLPPAGLAGVAPHYIPAIPLDPLATAGELIAFSPDEGRPRVYSVGEDGIDDGGWPADSYATRPEELRMTDYVIDLKRQARPIPPPAATAPQDFSTRDFPRRRQRD
jgi:hypothetical protein